MTLSSGIARATSNTNTEEEKEQKKERVHCKEVGMGGVEGGVLIKRGVYAI